ncbi:hypothetical protein BDW02DRAFT_150785 [Decorospora gaudefroyi]|uniref:Uncharacterized protein n=1 Tax=Decorospora gaudefroyi TaxID=184978 RepID=A0A6A5KVI6_9PLEO|nr:hypothetical protein BDW02DRAFT_150785 [Decorospora gaudefroyi]
MSGHDSEPTEVPGYHEVLPKYSRIFEKSVHTYLDHLPVPRPGSYDPVSPLIPPFRREETPYIDNANDYQDGESAGDGIPAHLRHHDPFKIRIPLHHFRILMMRCEVLQSTVNTLERKPWAHDSDQVLQSYYRNMRYAAIKARKLAQDLLSDELQARAEYWAGRGCGGLRDWQDAVSHFTAAMKFDAPRGGSNQGEVGQGGGLSQNEREDVGFLLQSVKRRRDLKRERAKEGDRGPLEHVDDWEEPAWMPDRERLAEMAKKEADGAKRRSARYSQQFGANAIGEMVLAKEDIEAVHQRFEIADGKQSFRRRLGKEEWLWILHGDQKERGADAPVGIPPGRLRQLSDVSCASPSASTHTMPEMMRDGRGSSGKKSESSGVIDTVASPSPSPSLSPTAARRGLSQRRKHHLEPINTTSTTQRKARNFGTESDLSSPSDSSSKGEMVDIGLDDTPRPASKSTSKDDDV